MNTSTSSIFLVPANQDEIEPILMERIAKEDGKLSQSYVAMFKCPVHSSLDLYKVSIYNADKNEFYGQSASFSYPIALEHFDSCCNTYNKTSLKTLQEKATRENQEALAKLCVSALKQAKS